MYTFYPTRPFRHVVQVTILREETLHRMSCHKESEMFLFSVYSHVNTDFTITVPLKRNITQITSTYSQEQVIYAQLKPLTQCNGLNSSTMKM